MLDAALDNDDEDGRALAGVLRLQPPDSAKWKGSSDLRPAKAFLYKVAAAARLTALSEINTWRFLTQVCLQERHTRELLSYLEANHGAGLSIADKLRFTELWFNHRWNITNSVDRVYQELEAIKVNDFTDTETLHSRLLSAQQDASYLGHTIPPSTLRRSFLKALPDALKAPLLQVIPSPDAPLNDL
ncbi:hypothetical protein Pmar_PMAR015531, partial [Perkinsus marinus ATCC 50983]